MTTGECKSSSSLYGGPPSLNVMAGNCSLEYDDEAFVSVVQGGAADHCSFPSSQFDTAGSDSRRTSLAGVERPELVGGGP